MASPPRLVWNRAKFLGAAPDAASWPRHKAAEVALAGRSNVGKSSLLNALTGNSKLARVSKAPGCTRGILFFQVSPGLCLVDLPGYGFARRSKAEREAWREEIEQYIENRENLRLVIVVLDARLGPTELDRELLEYLAGRRRPVLAVLAKADQLQPSRRKAHIEGLKELLPPDHPRDLFVLSSKTGEGIFALRARLEALAGT